MLALSRAEPRRKSQVVRRSRGNVGKCMVIKPLSQLTPTPWIVLELQPEGERSSLSPVACVFSFLWPFDFRRIELLMYFFMPNLMAKSVCCYLLRFVRKAREALTEGCRLRDAIVGQSGRNFSRR